MKALNRILSRVFPGYITLSEFSETYLGIVAGRPFCQHTKNSHGLSVRYLTSEIGDMPMRAIKPVHVPL
jgi:hypothetical protein